jgi:hypothetical protein
MEKFQKCLGQNHNIKSIFASQSYLLMSYIIGKAHKDYFIAGFQKVLKIFKKHQSP